jgi:integrase
MFNRQVVYLKAAFKYALRKGYVEANIFDRLDFIKVRNDKEVETVSAEVVEKMLRDASVNDPALLPYLVLGLFCGVRPYGELYKVRWSDLSFEGEPTLTIRPEVCKVPRRRFIDLHPNTIAWLKRCLPSDEDSLPSTLIVPLAKHILDAKKDRLCKRLGIQSPKNSMRHTFCSCWLAKWNHRSEGETEGEEEDEEAA